MSIKVTNATQQIIHIGSIALQPGVNTVDDAFKDFANASDYIRDYVAQFTDFVPKDLDIVKLNVSEAVKVITEETDVEVLKLFKEAESALAKPRQTVIKALNDKLSGLSEEPSATSDSESTAETQA